MIVYQYDRAGLYSGTTEADESPLEPGVYLIPARCTHVEPPADVPDDKWPRWNGCGWDLVNRPTAAQPTALEKLQAFMEANPDVAELITNDGGANA